MCVASQKYTIPCRRRTAVVEIFPKLYYVASRKTIYAQPVRAEAQDSACSGQSMASREQLLAQAEGIAIAKIRTALAPSEKTLSVTVMADDGQLASDASKKAFASAVAFIKGDRWDRACALWRDLARHEGNSVALHYNLGLCDEHSGHLEQAMVNYRHADQELDKPNDLVAKAIERVATQADFQEAFPDYPRDAPTLASKPPATAPPKPRVKPSVRVSDSKSRMNTLRPNPELRSQNRVALVIGNSAYRHAPPLANPVNDARDIAAALTATGFTVVAVEDADYRQLNKAVKDFTRRIKSNGIALVYYSGHGVQVDGENYLIPVDADIEDQDEVRYKSVPLGYLMTKLNAKSAAVNLVVLDACRNNPFADSARGLRRGLAPINAPSGTLVAYATAPGKVAVDGRGGNSPYTGSLARHIRESGVKIEDTFKKVRYDVNRDTGGKQIPWESSSLFEDFYFVPPRPQG